jgi:hypothetical protein
MGADGWVSLHKKGSSSSVKRYTVTVTGSSIADLYPYMIPIPRNSDMSAAVFDFSEMEKFGECERWEACPIVSME